MLPYEEYYLENVESTHSKSIQEIEFSQIEVMHSQSITSPFVFKLDMYISFPKKHRHKLLNSAHANT